MAVTYLLDTDIVMDLFLGVDPACQFIKGLRPRQAALSVITYAEILLRVENAAQERDFELLCERFLLYPLDKTTAVVAAQLHAKHGWKMPSAFQAALAVQHKSILVTTNAHEFDPKEHKFVKIPYRTSR